MPGLLTRIKRSLSHRSPIRLGWHKAKAFVAAARYGFPARHLFVIGITGTDGKTTTVGMASHILHESGIAVGALSTAFFRIKNEVTWNATQKTSPSPFVIQQFLQRLVRAGCTHAVLECSSHGLVQGRTAWTWPAVAAITNISAEHLDYHGTMEQYRRDKGILFEMLRGRGTKVLNRDDTTYAMYRTIPSATTISFGRKNPASANDRTTADLSLREVAVHPESTRAVLQIRDERGDRTHPLTLCIVGDFNLENALCAIGCAVACGIDPKKAADSLASFGGVPGRIERIDEGQPFSVFIDFTVTPASYERTLSTLKAMLPSGKRLLVLAGSCGDRMKEKRPLVGKLCSQFADVVVITNEDPYTEDPEKIIDEVFAGIDTSKTRAHRISDRGEAIGFLLKEAKPGDIVLFCGKGSDTTMMIGTTQIPWNEREIVQTVLKASQ